MISVIVPVYKVEKYLENCVHSICQQSYKDLEIILVDDGSPDRCGELCDKLAEADNRIIVLHKNNEGLSAARNSGLDIAKGKYISFVDSDDTINPDMFMSLVTSIEANACDICMCGSNTLDASSRIIASDVFPSNMTYTLDELMNAIILPLKTASWNKLYKKSLIQNHRFPAGRIHGEDLVFILNTLQTNTKVCTTDYIGYNYYKRTNSITTGQFSTKAFDEVWCKDKALSIIEAKFPSYAVQFKPLCFRARLNLLRKMTKAKSKDRAEYKNYTKWLTKEYSLFHLPVKDQIEFILFKFFNSIYAKTLAR